MGRIRKLIPGVDKNLLIKDAAKLMPDCESHRLDIEDRNVDIVPAEEWYAMADDIVAILADFLSRKLPREARAANA